MIASLRLSQRPLVSGSSFDGTPTTHQYQLKEKRIMQSRRQFFARTGAVAAATVFSGLPKATAFGDDDSQVQPNPVLRELIRIGKSDDAQAVNQMMADF